MCLTAVAQGVARLQVFAPIEDRLPRKMSAATLVKRLGTSRRDLMAKRPYEVTASPMRICLLGLAMHVAASTSAAAQSAQAESQPPPLMDREAEIALAISACPPSVASKAAVYVLDRSGYVKVRESQSGFTAIVQHSLPTSREPQCIGAKGTRTLLPRMLKVAELRAQGKAPRRSSAL
jgi:hypothetical protein